MDDNTINELRTLEQKSTAGTWSLPHFADDSVTCGCTSILCEAYCGAVAQVYYDNGLNIQDGGNGAPPLEEAKANARLIPTMKAYFPALLNLWEAAEQLEATDTAYHMSGLGDPAAAYSNLLSAMSALRATQIVLE